MAVNQEIKITFSVDDSQLEGAKKATIDLGNAAEADKKKYKELADIIEQEVTKVLKEAGLESGKFSAKVTEGTKQAGTSVKTLTAELKQAKQAAIEAGAKFGESSKEFAAAAKRAGELKAQLGDLNQTLDALDPDAKAKAFSQVGQAAFGAFQVATGALQAFGVESEKVNKLAQQFQGLLNISAGISQLGQLGDALKNVSTVLGFTTTAQKAATVATELDATAKLADAAATDVATVSTKAFTAALITSPLVLFAAAAGAIAGAIYLVDEANEEAIESSIRLQKKFEDLAAAQVTFDDNFSVFQSKRIQGIEDEIALAQAQGLSQEKIIALEIEKQKAIIETNRASYGQGTIEDENNRIAQNERATAQIIILQAKLTKFLKDEQDKRTEDARKANDKRTADAIKAEQDRLAQLKAQQDKELSTQLSDADAKLNIQKLINAEKFFDKQDELKLADLASELQTTDEKIEILKTFGLEYTREFELLLAKRNLLQRQYDGANITDQRKTLNDWLNDNKEVINAALQAFAAVSSAITDITRNSTEERIALINEQYDAEREGYESLLNDKRISQKQYDDSVAASEKRKEQEIKKLEQEQAKREKALAIFNATINGALAILNASATLNPAIIALTAATVAAQLATIIATPIPRFAKGTLSVPGGQEGTDSVHAMLMPGEAVIPTRVNRKYKEPIKAIFHESVGADELTQFIQMTPNMRYALLMAAGEQFNESIVNKPTNISTAQIMNSYITQAVRGGAVSSGSGRGASVNVDMSGVERSIRNNKTVRLDNTKQLAQQIAASITDIINVRRKW